MATLSVTARGQVTFRKSVLEHLGIRPGDRIRLDLLPNGRAELQAARSRGSWLEIAGMLGDRGNGVRLSLDELDEAIADAGTAAGLAGLERG